MASILDCTLLRYILGINNSYIDNCEEKEEENRGILSTINNTKIKRQKRTLVLVGNLNSDFVSFGRLDQYIHNSNGPYWKSTLLYNNEKLFLGLRNVKIKICKCNFIDKSQIVYVTSLSLKNPDHLSFINFLDSLVIIFNRIHGKDARTRENLKTPYHIHKKNNGTVLIFLKADITKVIVDSYLCESDKTFTVDIDVLPECLVKNRTQITFKIVKIQQSSI